MTALALTLNSDIPVDYRVLALSGGGFLGLCTPEVLSALESRAGEPLGRSLALLAGTSIGYILAGCKHLLASAKRTLDTTRRSQIARLLQRRDRVHA